MQMVVLNVSQLPTDDSFSFMGIGITVWLRAKSAGSAECILQQQQFRHVIGFLAYHSNPFMGLYSLCMIEHIVVDVSYL